MQEAQTVASEPTSTSLLSDADIRSWIPDSMEMLMDTLASYPLLLVVVLFSLGYFVGKIFQWLFLQPFLR